MTDAMEQGHAWRPRRFMVIVGHPDDAEFGVAGTAAAWIDAGARGWLVCGTSGDAGGEDPGLDPFSLASIREEEQRRAAAIVGYDGVTAKIVRIPLTRIKEGMAGGFDESFRIEIQISSALMLRSWHSRL